MKQARDEHRAELDPAVKKRRGAAEGRVAADDDGARKRPAGERETGPGKRPSGLPVDRTRARGKIEAVRESVRQHPFLAAGVALVLIGGLVGSLLWWLDARHYESTDDAFIDARTISIGSQVNGAIVEVAVTDNQSAAADTFAIASSTSR